MDVLLGLIFFVIKFILPFFLFFLIVYLIWKLIGDIIAELIKKIWLGLRKFIDSIRYFFSFKGITNLVNSIVEAIGNIFNLVVTKFTHFVTNFVKKSFSVTAIQITKFINVIFGALILQRHTTAKRRVKTLFRVNKSDASRVAKQRQKFVEEIMGESTTLVFKEVLELPPGYDDTVISSEELSSQEAIAQMVRLRWQLQEELYLLFGRAQDTLVAILRKEGDLSLTANKKFFTNSMLDISLRRLKHKEISSEIFPWSVVVGTNQPKLLSETLMTLKEWIGIGIDIAKPLHVKRLGSCKHSPDVVGEVTGFLMQNAESKNVQSYVYEKNVFALTCKHVIPHCDCDVTHGDLENGSQPDAALLPLIGNCFTPNTQRHVPIDTATKFQLKEIAVEEKTVQRLGGKSKIYSGLIENPGTSFTCEGVLSEFPTFSVVLDKKHIFGIIPLPFFRKTFSEPGDSGAWVLNEERDKWLGMVYVGSKRAGLTYVLSGSALLNHFELDLVRISNSKISRKLTPLYLEKGD